MKNKNSIQSSLFPFSIITTFILISVIFLSINAQNLKHPVNKNTDLIFDQIDSNKLLYGKPIKGFSLPENNNNSFIDKLGNSNLLAKSITKNCDLICSYHELRYLMDLSYPKDSGTFTFTSKPKRIPDHWEKLNPVVRDIKFNSPLYCLIISEDKTYRFDTIQTLKAKRFYTWARDAFLHPQKLYTGDCAPIEYESDIFLEKDIVCILLTPTVCNNLKQNIKNAPIQIIKTKSDNSNKISLFVDLNDDKIYEIAAFALIECEEEDMCKKDIAIAISTKGSWYRTALQQDNQQTGTEGY